MQGFVFVPIVTVIQLVAIIWFFIWFIHTLGNIKIYLRDIRDIQQRDEWDRRSS